MTGITSISAFGYRLISHLTVTFSITCIDCFNTLCRSDRTYLSLYSCFWAVLSGLTYFSNKRRPCKVCEREVASVQNFPSNWKEYFWQDFRKCFFLLTNSPELLHSLAFLQHGSFWFGNFPVQYRCLCSAKENVDCYFHINWHVNTSYGN